MKIKHILFDIDDTLFPTTEFAKLARKNAINAMIQLGLNKDQNRLYNSLIRIVKEKGSNYNKHFNDLLKSLKIKNKSKYIAAAIAAYHSTKNSIMPYPEVPRVLLNLRNNYKIYVATQGDAIKQWDKLIRLKLALLFQDVFISQELKVEKSPKFFKKIIKFLDVEPKECIMVGDKPDSDVKFAKKTGIRTIRIKSGKYKNKNSVADLEINNFYELEKAIKKFETKSKL